MNARIPYSSIVVARTRLAQVVTALLERGSGKVGWVEEGQFQLHDRSPFAAPTDVSAAQSVNDLAQVKQIPESAQIVVVIADIVRRCSPRRLRRANWSTQRE